MRGDFASVTSSRRIILTGGGTAGHVTPNIALLDGLRDAGFEIHYIGRRSGIEKELMTAEGVPYRGIPAGKLRRYLDLRNFTDVAAIAAGFVFAVHAINRVKPGVVFSKGGFVSCPVVWAAWTARVPVVIHESDIVPGLANRLSLPFARRICCCFPETLRHLPNAKAVLTGLPIRRALLTGDAAAGRKRCGFDMSKPVVLVTGGSQGSESVNGVLRAALDILLPRFQICHLCGAGNVAGDLTRPGYCQIAYAKDELPDLLAAADCVVSRAGATSLFEILALRKPNLLIPLPLSASRGDQILNARSFAARGYSAVLPQEELSPERLTQEVVKLHGDRRAAIDAMSAAGASDAARRVCEEIERAAKG